MAYRGFMNDGHIFKGASVVFAEIYEWLYFRKPNYTNTQGIQAEKKLILVCGTESLYFLWLVLDTLSMRQDARKES